MNNHDHLSNCEEFELLISCSLDGELTNDEQSRLSQHLSVCPSCRRRNENFCSVNHYAGRLGSLEPTMELECVELECVSSANHKNEWSSRNPMQSNDYVPYAALAGLLAIVAVSLGMVLSGARRADAGEIVDPIVSLAHINSTRQADQAILKESLELDLRTLRLEIELLNDVNQSKSTFREKHDLLLKKINDIQ